MTQYFDTHIKKDPEREVPKSPTYPKFVDIVLNHIRHHPDRVSINIQGQKKCRHSYGVILYTYSKDGRIEYLCAKKKDTIEYYIFITGQYNDKQLWNIFSLMTNEERCRLLKYIDDFRALWDDLWVNHNSKFYRDDYPRAKQIFDQIKIYIPNLIRYSSSITSEPEWVWPKGQKNRHEHNDLLKGALRAAVREFREETGITLQVDLSQNYPFYSEQYLGSNNFPYSTTYFAIPVAAKLELPPPIKKEKGCREKNECISYDFETLDWFEAENAPVNSRRKELLLKIDRQLKISNI